jgi:hypothetical protein
MRGDHPSCNFDAPSTHQPLVLLLMPKVVKSHVKVEKPGKMQGKGARRRFKKSVLIQKVVFWISTSLISKQSKPTTCTPCNQS